MEYDTAYWRRFFETDIGLSKAEIITTYAEKFESQGITKKILLDDITEVDLEKLEIAMGHRKLIIRHIKEHQKNLTAPNATPPSNQTSPISSPPKKKSKKDEFLETIKDKGRDIIVGEATSIITHLEDENTILQEKIRKKDEKIDKMEWPNRFRAAVLGLEGKYNSVCLDLCKTCAQVHPNQSCAVGAISIQRPTAEKERRIVNRRERLRWIISNHQNDAEASKIILNLGSLQRRIKKKTDPLDEGEEFISNLNTIDDLIFHFADSVARLFEELSSNIKLCGEMSGLLESLGLFTPPNNLFAAVLVNSIFVLNKKGKLTYVEGDVKTFEPKKKS